MERDRFRSSWVSLALLLVAFVAGSVTCFENIEDEIARLTTIVEDLSDGVYGRQPDLFMDESEAPLVKEWHPLMFHVTQDHIDPSFPPYREYEAARETGPVGVAGLGHAQDRESLESDSGAAVLDLEQIFPSSHPVGGGQPDADAETVVADPERRPFDRNPLLRPASFDTFFNTPLETQLFGGGGLGGGMPSFNFFDLLHSSRPWWKGENVCTEREENEEELESPDCYSLWHSINLNMQTCSMKQDKYVCISVKNVNGRKRTEKVSHQCCHGYGVARGGAPNAHCEKLDLHSMEETAGQLGAKEFIATLKKSGLESTLDNPVTLFVVPDAAYSTFAEQMWENNLVAFDPMARSKRAIDFASMTARDVILAHTVNGTYRIEDVSNEQLLKTDLPRANIRINIYPRRPAAMELEREQHGAELPYRYTANCAPLVTVNRLSDHGIVHVVNRVLVPARNSLMDIVEARDDLTLMRTFLEMTGLDKMLRDTPEGGAYTIFAPNDDAFLKLDKDIRRKLKTGNGCAINILKNHILDLTFCSVAAASGVKTSTTNMLNDRLEFEYAAEDAPDSAATETTPAADGAKPAQPRIRINGLATIREADVMASNGVLHVIDSVLPTDRGMPMSSTLDGHNLTIFKQLLADAGLEDEFDELSNRTFFIPTDQAFEQTDAGRHWIRQLKEHPASLRDNAALREFLGYHVVEPLIKTANLEETMLPTKVGQEVRVNLYTTNPLFNTVMNRATINCARLVAFNDETCGSVVHQIDRVLDVPKKNLLETLASNPEYSMFLGMVRDTNLTEMLAAKDAGLTLLVPKNDVFLEVNAWYQETLANKDELERVLRAHILPNVICCTGIVPSEWPFVRTTETIGGNQLKLHRARRPEVENAGITKCDIVAQNGIIHEINDVINVQAQRGGVQAAGGNSPFPSFGSLGRPLNFWFK